MVNVLVVNLHSARNAGDAVLLAQAVQQLRRALPGAQITLAQNDLTSSLEVGPVRRVLSFQPYLLQERADRSIHWRLDKLAYHLLTGAAVALWFRATGRPAPWLPAESRALLEAYLAADLVVSCPGNIFFTMGRFGLPFLISAFTASYGLWLGKPLYVLPQSFGPLERWWERRIVRAILGRARLVYAREPVSLDLLHELGLCGPRYRLCPDLAFAFPAASPQETAAEMARLEIPSQTPRLGVTVINRMVRSIDEQDWKTYRDAVSVALDRFHTTYNGQAVLFPQVTGPTLQEDDRVTARYIVSHMEHAAGALSLEEAIHPALLKGMYGQMDLFIATRMHSGIFALSMGIPTLFIAYLHKTHGLARMLGIQDWVIDMAQVNGEQLWEKLQALWEQRALVRAHLDQVLPTLLAQADRVAQIIAEDYDER